MSMFTRGGFSILPLIVLGAMSGCCEWDCKKPNWMRGKDEPRSPEKVVAMWSDTILYRTDQPQPIRGFGGRLMFYAEKTEKPVKVEGTLTVYAFDETHGKKDDPRPTRKYVFTSEQFTHHYSKSDIGHSYSIWLPWDSASNAPCKISLIVRFMPKRGSLVIGEESLQLLPGPETPNTMPTQTGGTLTPPNLVRPASHEVEVPGRLDAAAPSGRHRLPCHRRPSAPSPFRSRRNRECTAMSA